MVLLAIGWVPDIFNLNIEKIGLKYGEWNEIIVDENHMTNIENIFAIGDCIDKVNLTPVAIRAGRIVGEYLYGNKNLKMDYEDVPTVIFSHPPTIHIGLNEN